MELRIDGCWSINSPQRQRIHILDEDALAGECRLRPRGAVGDGIALQRLERARARPRHDQFGIVVEQEQQAVSLDDGGVRRLARRAEPQDLAGLRIDREVLAAIALLK